jgi:hypothetical protein
VLAGNCVGIHNGIIINNEIWKKAIDLRRQYQVDSEVILPCWEILGEQASIIKAAQRALR